MAKKNTISEARKRLTASMAVVAKERDKLETLIEDTEALKRALDEAYDHLREARDCLSEVV